MTEPEEFAIQVDFVALIEAGDPLFDEENPDEFLDWIGGNKTPWEE